MGSEWSPTEPAISRDGRRLAFASNGLLYVREAGVISPVIPSHAASGPAFFPDGRQIAFAEGQPGRRSIRVVSVSGGQASTLTERGDCFAPAISPDGTLLAHVVSGTGNRQVWVQDLTSHASWPITSGACNNDAPAWDADSRTVVFASDCGRGLGLPALYRIAARPGGQM